MARESWSIVRGLTRLPSGRRVNAPAVSVPYFFLNGVEQRRFGQREEHDFFSGNRADVAVQAQHLDACDLLDDRFQDWARRLDQMRAHLLENISSLRGRERLD